eukprot:COSAG01_NODE_970_length_12375_cov_27.268736_10_plen_57_part_00
MLGSRFRALWWLTNSNRVNVTAAKQASTTVAFSRGRCLAIGVAADSCHPRQPQPQL